MGIDDMISEDHFRSNDRLPVMALCLNETFNSSSGMCSNLTVNEHEDDGEESEELNYTKISVLSVIIILTVIGNICVILAIFCRQMKMTRMYYFILHLSLADILTAFFTLLPELIWTFTWPNFYGGDFVCKTVKFLQMVGPYLSSYVLIMTAIDRFQAICHPLSNCTWTPKRSNIMITVAWVISVLLCVPQILIFHGADETSCTAHFAPGWGVKAYVTWFAFSNFFIPFVVLVYCYGRICHAIWDNFNSKTSNKVPEESPHRARGSIKGGKRAKPHWRRRISKALTMKGRGTKRTSQAQNGQSEQIKMRWKSTKKQPQQLLEENEDTGQTRIVIEPPSSSPIQKGGGSKNKSQNTTSFMPKSSRRSLSPDSSPSPPLGRSKRVINPRSHSIRGISRAKMKTVKLTVVVIMGYIICSTPFICVQLWATWGRPSHAVMQSITWLFWLLTLNSVVNPWIYMFFNVNLVEALCRACCAYQTPFPRRTNVTNGIGLRSRNEAKCPRGTGLQRKFSQSVTGIMTLNGSQDLIRSRSNTNGSHTSLTLLTNTSIVKLSEMEKRDSQGSSSGGSTSKVTFEVGKGTVAMINHRGNKPSGSVSTGGSNLDHARPMV